MPRRNLAGRGAAPARAPLAGEALGDGPLLAPARSVTGEAPGAWLDRDVAKRVRRAALVPEADRAP